MHARRRRRLYFVIFFTTGTSIAVGLSLFALRQNINLYYTPAQVQKYHEPVGREFRLGGMVVKGSVRHVTNTLQVSFVLTDFHAQLPVQFDGVLPSLFREGQGVVAQGKLNEQGVFVADEVLAKHDNQYKPPVLGAQ